MKLEEASRCFCALGSKVILLEFHLQVNPGEQDEASLAAQWRVERTVRRIAGSRTVSIQDMRQSENRRSAALSDWELHTGRMTEGRTIESRRLPVNQADTWQPIAYEKYY